MEIERSNAVGYSIEVKRFYLPYKLSGICPDCKEDWVQDFSSNYLSYPKLGEFMHTCYCHSCEYEWEIKLKLDVVLTIVK